MSNNETPQFPPEVFKLFDKYVHGAISRRDFIDRAAAYSIAGMSGAAQESIPAPVYFEAPAPKTLPPPGRGSE